MKTLNHKKLVGLLLVIVLAVATSGCGQIAADSNFTLEAGDTVSGSLFIFSQNAILEEGSSVEGTVIMICCNLTVDGEVDGNIFLLTGNIMINANADVNGEVGVISGNVSR